LRENIYLKGTDNLSWRRLKIRVRITSRDSWCTWKAPFYYTTQSKFRILIAIFLKEFCFSLLLLLIRTWDKNTTGILINKTVATDRTLKLWCSYITDVITRSLCRSEISRYYDQLIVNDILPWCPWTCGNSKQRRTSTRMTGATRSWHSAAWLLRFALISRPTLPVCPADVRWHVF